MTSILFIDKDEENTPEIIKFLEDEGHFVDWAKNLYEAISKLSNTEYSIIIADAYIDGGTLNDLYDVIDESPKDSKVIVSLDCSQISRAVEIMQKEAYDLLLKPINYFELKQKVDKASEMIKLNNEVRYLNHERNLIYRSSDIISKSQRMRKVLDIVDKVAKTDSSILILGETGTGKELIAGAIHYSSLRSNNPFIKVNCSALSEQLLESELFGHVAGAYQGADKPRQGRLEEANGGSLFLDEISDLNSSIQAKLLRAIQEKTFEKIGGNKTIKTDIRYISTSNKDLINEIREGRLREDLYYRLNVVTINIPPLRERREDIVPLSYYLLGTACRELKKSVRDIHPDTQKLLMGHPWPGNIRELKNVIEHGVMMVEGDVLKPEHLEIHNTDIDSIYSKEIVYIPEKGVNFEDVEKELILKALRMRKWVQKDAAELIGMSKRVFNYKIKKHGITHERWKKNNGLPPKR
ncbi:MAG: sigma-54-dependent Fis family transcriptional regulator [Spirochaetales bacterium]|nr:sigma-54-dependent Fis family transcriptional regulator [Spirochaetales bacterium]